VISESRSATTELDEAALPRAIDSAEQRSPTSVVMSVRDPRDTGTHQTMPALLDSPSAAPAPRSRRGLLLLLLATMLLLVLGGVASLLVWRAQGGSQLPALLRPTQRGQTTTRATAPQPAGGTQPDQGRANTPASLLLQVMPDGTRVEVDGRLVTEDGNSDGVLVPVPPRSRVTLQLSKPGYQTFTHQIISPASGIKHLTVELPRAPGSAAEIVRAKVSVVTDPPGATLTIDGKPFGTTPAIGLELPAATTHAVTLVKAGYQKWTGTLVAQTSDESSWLRVKLRALR
jgi:hypothetical protein